MERSERLANKGCFVLKMEETQTIINDNIYLLNFVVIYFFAQSFPKYKDYITWGMGPWQRVDL
jgi:hypothetical protein